MEKPIWQHNKFVLLTLPTKSELNFIICVQVAAGGLQVKPPSN